MVGVVVEVVMVAAAARHTCMSSCIECTSQMQTVGIPIIPFFRLRASPAPSPRSCGSRRDRCTGCRRRGSGRSAASSPPRRALLLLLVVEHHPHRRRVVHDLLGKKAFGVITRRRDCPLSGRPPRPRGRRRPASSRARGGGGPFGGPGRGPVGGLPRVPVDVLELEVGLGRLARAGEARVLAAGGRRLPVRRRVHARPQLAAEAALGLDLAGEGVLRLLLGERRRARRRRARRGGRRSTRSCASAR